MKKKYRVSLTNEERTYAHEVLESKETATGFRKRASILIMLDEGVGEPETHKQIAARCNVSEVTVWQTSKSYCETGIEKALTFQSPSHPPRPAIVTGEKEARIIALACGEPPKGYSRWTVRLLTEKVVELSILPTTSRETVRRTLKKLNLSLT
jgi:transposase